MSEPEPANKLQTFKEHLNKTAKSILKQTAAAAPAALFPEHALLMTAVGVFVTETIESQFERVAGMRRKNAEQFRSQAFEGIEDANRILEPEELNLIDEGTIQASKATEQRRITMIANIVASGINNYGKALQARRNLAILSNLGELELFLFSSFRTVEFSPEDIQITSNAILLPDTDAYKLMLQFLGEDLTPEGEIPPLVQAQYEQVIKTFSDNKMIQGHKIVYDNQNCICLDDFGVMLFLYLEMKNDERPK